MLRVKNTQDDSFKFYYDKLHKLIESFVEDVIDSLDSKNVVNSFSNVFSYLIDIYVDTFQGELEYIIKTLGFEYTESEMTSIRNGVLPASYVNSNYKRVLDIFSNYVRDIYDKKNEGLSNSVIVESYKPIIERVATSELHNVIEKSSVESAKLLQIASNQKILKIWNCNHDGLTCPICLALEGTVVGVEEVFTFDDDSLDYTGGDIAYAHPRCRCWLTYKKA